MAGSPPSVYRAAFQVTPARIAQMNEHELNELMRDLLRAQAYRSGADVGAVRVNAEIKAGDEGCDAWTPQPARSDNWLGEKKTCWQLKSGQAGIPSKMPGEVLKRIPKETLASGGRFVVVASGSKSGKSGDDSRLKPLLDEAKAHGIPIEGISVMGSEALALWCNEHPAIAARWATQLDSLYVLKKWEQSTIHKVPWQADSTTRTRITEFQHDLDFEQGPIKHLHIQGPPGVGKTRFALELCRAAPWREEVVYAPQAQGARLLEIINSASEERDARLMIIADEVQSTQLAALRDALDYCDGRIRLVTIGHTSSHDPARTPTHEIRPLDRQGMMNVVKSWYPGMPYEHADFIVRLADGFIRLAKLASDTVAKNPTTDVQGILDLKHVQDFLSKMLGNGNRRALHVLACLNVVGWDGDVQEEGKAIATHLGLDWNDTRVAVEEFQRVYGIAPQGGRYRYISPRPLANYLAIEAWKAYPHLLRSLPDSLPNEAGRAAYYERLTQIASSPQARSFSREQLGFFLTLRDFLDSRAARRWAALVNSDPTAAVKGLSEILLTSTVEDRLQLADSSRREVVGALVRLAWGKAAFRHASKALAMLAEAENENWGNNATAEFINGYNLVLGGTALPYKDRIQVLNELLALNRPLLNQLVVRALTQIGNRHATRSGFEPAGPGIPEVEWQPQGSDKLDCTLLALNMLTGITAKASPELKEDLMKAAQAVSWMLAASPVRNEVSEFFNSLRRAYPETREPLRALIARTISFERRDVDPSEEADLEEMELVLRTFEENTLWGRLQQLVGPGSWGDDVPDLTSLAQELLSNPGSLAEHWPWLTSGEANDSWRLGQALAKLDHNGELEFLLPSLPGRGTDQRIIGLYVSTRRAIKGDSWYEDWFHKQHARTPSDIPLLLDLVWRAGATDAILQLFTQAIKLYPLDASQADALGYGHWHGEVSKEVLRGLLQELTTQKRTVAVITIIHERIKLAAGEIDWWEDLAMKTITNVDLIRAEHNYSSYHWKEVVENYLPRRPVEIVGAIFDARIEPSKGYWSMEYNVREVIEQAIEIDATCVWEELAARLGTSGVGYMFTIGFPEGLVDTLPHEEILEWVAHDPPVRASLMARLVKLDFRTDETLASKILGRFGEHEEVGDSFSAAYSSGMWSGTWAGHYESLATGLERVIEHSTLPKLRTWAQEKAAELKSRAEAARTLDEEDDLPRR